MRCGRDGGWSGEEEPRPVRAPKEIRDALHSYLYDRKWCEPILTKAIQDAADKWVGDIVNSRLRQLVAFLLDVKFADDGKAAPDHRKGGRGDE